MNKRQIINELQSLRAMGAQVAERSYQLMQTLGHVDAPATRKGKALTDEEHLRLVKGFRKRLTK